MEDSDNEIDADNRANQDNAHRLECLMSLLTSKSLP
jgi:hypothetical protein